MIEAVGDVRAIEDPVRRARAISDLLKAQADVEPELRQERARVVHQLRDEGVSLRKIAEQVGTSLGTVQDILRGHSGPWGNRPKKGDPPPAE